MKKKKRLDDGDKNESHFYEKNLTEGVQLSLDNNAAEKENENNAKKKKMKRKVRTTKYLTE